MEHDSIFDPVVLGPVFPIFLIGMWLVILNVLSLLGGWRELARSYRANGRPDGPRFSFRSATLGFVNYGSCLTFVAARAGLFVAVLAPFRPGHRPLFVPWADVSAATHRGWIFRYIDLRFTRHPKVRMRLTRSLAEKLLQAGGNAVQLPSAT